jgi:hypothetical protein
MMPSAGFRAASGERAMPYPLCTSSGNASGSCTCTVTPGVAELAHAIQAGAQFGDAFARNVEADDRDFAIVFHEGSLPCRAVS